MITIVLEELNFTWNQAEIKEFRKMWRNDVPLSDMIEYFNRPAAEIALLVMDQELKGRIFPRKIGLEQ